MRYLGILLLGRCRCKDRRCRLSSQDVAPTFGTKELNMALSRYVSVAFAAGLVGTLSSLIQPAHVTELWSASVAQAPIPDPSPLPCKKQSWYSADRICLSWTAPRNNTHHSQPRLIGVPANVEVTANRSSENNRR